MANNIFEYNLFYLPCVSCFLCFGFAPYDIDFYFIFPFLSLTGLSFLPSQPSLFLWLIANYKFYFYILCDYLLIFFLFFHFFIFSNKFFWKIPFPCNDFINLTSSLFFVFCFPFFVPFIFISWKLITLQYCSGFCHTLTWISHGFTCIPHPDPPSHLPLYPIPVGLPSVPGPSTCLMHPTWAGDLFHPR